MYPFIVIVGGICVFTLVKLLLAAHDSSRKANKLGQTPPCAPGRLPVFGHAFAMLYNPYRLVTSLDPTRIVSLRLPGIDPILVQGRENVRRLFQLSSMSNPAHAQQFIASRLFGMPAEASASFVRDTSGIAAKPRPGSTIDPKDRICYRDHEIIHSTFRGPRLADLVQTFSRLLQESIRTLPVSREWLELPDLFTFLTAQITPLTVETLCGPSLTKVIDPDFVRDFWIFDSWVPWMTKKVPRWFIPKAYDVRDRLLDSIKQWRVSTLSDSGDCDQNRGCQGMVDKFKLLEVEGWSIEAIASSDLGLIWAANSNTVSCLYWMLYEMYRSPSLMTHVQRECQASSKSASREFDLSTLLKQPYLQAIFAETLRYRNHIFMTRFPDPHDMYVNGWRLPAGKVVMTCSTVQHMNSTLWNTGNNNSHPIDTFWPGRFLVSQELSQVAVGGRRDSAISLEHDREAGDPNMQAPKFSTKGLDGAWIPFGGGTQMCPGQKLAKAEIFLAVATLLANFDIELKDPAVAMSVNWWHFGTGVAKPADKLPFRVRRRL